MLGALLALFLLAAPPAQAKPSVYGFNFPAWWHDTYSSPETLESLRRLAASGAKWVAFTPSWYVDTLSSNRVAPDEEKTPTDASLRAAMGRARDLGLKLVLKPHVDVKTGEFRGALRPKDEDAWFESYDEFILHYARLAEEEGCELFIVGTELNSLSGMFHGKRWDRIIGEVRQRYSGKLTYAANWDAVHLTPFWERLDFIGVDGYYPVLGGDVIAFRLGWAAHAAHLGALTLRWSKPLLFTEVGLTSQRGANDRPAEWREFGEVDLKVQKDYMQAFLEEFSGKDWFAGFLYWAWETNPGAGGVKDKTMTVQGKPASALLRKYFKALK